jgi:hypothetical protein
MAEDNVPQPEQDFDLRASGVGLDPVNIDITQPAPKTPGIDVTKQIIPGIKPLDSALIPPGIMPTGMPSNISPLPENFSTSQSASTNLKQMLQSVQADGLNVKMDPWKMGKRVMGDFHNPNNMNQFYDRYAAHSDFDKLGFSPFRDNENLYNANSSFWDEMGRSSGEWATLAGLGFKDAMGFGDLSDTETAAGFEKAMAIGQSTQGGATGFTTNLFLNSGYTVGIMGELALEELAMFAAEAGLGIATAGSGGAAAPALAANTLAIGARAKRAFGKIGKVFDASKNLMKSLTSFKDASKARAYFNKAMTGTLNVINPVENTIDFFKAARAGDLGDIGKLAKTTKGFGEFYKDVRNIRLAYGEGALEGGMVQNQMTRDLLSDFHAKKGRAPNDDEAQELKMEAVTAGRSTAFVNMPLILLSNKMTFDGLVRGKFKNLSSEITKIAGRKVLFNAGKKNAAEAFKLIPKNYFKAKWEYMKSPKLWLKSGGLYTKANVAEGLQELGQETVSATFMGYHTAKFNGDPLRGGYYSFLGNALEEQVSITGLETFMSGFLMGGMVAPISNTVSATMQGKETANNMYKRVFKNEEWSKIRDQRDAQAAETVNKLNKFYADPRQYLNPALTNMQAQKEYQAAMKTAQENGSKKDYEDAKDGSLFEHISTALDAGSFESFIERLEDMKQMTPEEMKVFDPSQTSAEFLKGIDKSINQANRIKDRHSYFKNKKKNPFNPRKYKINSDEYISESKKHNAWNNAVNEAVYFQNAFDTALERQSEILENFKENAGLKNTDYSEVNVLFDETNIQREIDLLNNELEVLDSKSSDKAIRTAVKDKTKKRDALKNYIDAVFEMKSNPGEGESIKPEQYDKIEKAYKEYINYLNRKNKDYTNIEEVGESLHMILDWYNLEGRKKPAMDSVNVLLDSKNFLKSYDRHLELNELKMRQKKAEIEKSLKAYREKQDKNDMLNELADAGMFFDVEDLVKLEKDGVVPSKFYYMNSEGEKDDQVVKTSEDYQKAYEILQKYTAVTKGLDITNAKELHAYTGMSRKKDEKDKRTYEDLAEEFGFDPKNPTTRVPLRKVLQTIIDGKFSTKADIELAKKLLEQAIDKEYITFSRREPQPGMYSESSQTVIDSRYSSENWKQGAEGHPIEHIILKEEIGRRIYEKIAEDPEFKNDIDTLREEALEAFKKLSDEEKSVYFSGPFNLIDAQEFAKAAMTNERFQTFLSTVSSKTTTKTTWQKFVDAVLDVFENAFGTRPNGTVLNSVLELVTAKIDINPIEGSTTTTTTTPTSTTTTPTTPVGKYKGKDEIPASVKKLQNPAKLPPIVNIPMQTALRDLGFSETEISAMHKAGQVAEVQRIIDNVITRDEMVASKTEDTSNPERDKAAIDLRFYISELIKTAADAAGTKDDYKIWQETDEQIIALIQEDDQLVEESGWKIDEIRQQMQEIKEDIASKGVTFEKLTVGEDVILHKNEARAEVIDIKEGLVVLQYANGTKKVFSVNAEDVNKTIKFRSEPLMTIEKEVAPTASKEEQENINTSMEIIATPAEEIQDLVEGVKNKDVKDLKNNLLDSIC